MHTFFLKISRPITKVTPRSATRKLGALLLNMSTADHDIMSEYAQCVHLNNTAYTNREIVQSPSGIIYTNIFNDVISHSSDLLHFEDNRYKYDR
jgi:hypothetical protein